jgi:hypothetical protein
MLTSSPGAPSFSAALHQRAFSYNLKPLAGPHVALVLLDKQALAHLPKLYDYKPGWGRRIALLVSLPAHAHGAHCAGTGCYTAAFVCPCMRPVAAHVCLHVCHTCWIPCIPMGLFCRWLCVCLGSADGFRLCSPCCHGNFGGKSHCGLSKLSSLDEIEACGGVILCRCVPGTSAQHLNALTTAVAEMP